MKIREINAAERAQRRGQALLELAIFGMVAIAALGLLIRIGIQANADQEVRMGAFRRALAAAASDDERADGHAEDAMSVSYYYMLDRQMPNPGDGFLSLTRSRSQASAFVERGRWLTFGFEDAPGGDPQLGRRTHPRVIVRLNDQEQSFRDNDFPCDASAGVPCYERATGQDANEAIIRETWTTNTQAPGANQVRQTQTASTVSSRTNTDSRAVINLKTNEGASAGNGAQPDCEAEGVICSTLSPGVNVSWSH